MTSMPHHSPISPARFGHMNDGLVIVSNRLDCDLRLRDGRYLMRGPAGEHSLDAASTDLDRLNAHWKGFTAYNAASAALEAR